MEDTDPVDTRTYPAEHLRDFTRRVFEHFQLSEEDASLAAGVLSPLATPHITLTGQHSTFIAGLAFRHPDT